MEEIAFRMEATFPEALEIEVAREIRISFHPGKEEAKGGDIREILIRGGEDAPLDPAGKRGLDLGGDQDEARFLDETDRDIERLATAKAILEAVEEPRGTRVGEEDITHVEKLTSWAAPIQDP